MYPIGSYYLSDDSASPASLFGGEWEQIKDRFLIGAGGSYSINATGGATTHTHTTGGHTLSVNEIPSHGHSVQSAGAHSHSVKFSYSSDEYKTSNFLASRGDGTLSSFNTESAGSHTHTINNTGGGASHSHGNTGSANNLPPYKAIYIWRRKS